MRTLFAALALVTAFATHAAEIQYGKSEAHAAAGSLIAWTQDGALHIARIGSHGRPLKTTTIALPNATLSAPAIATDGASYLVAFSHFSNAGLQVAATSVDAYGNAGGVRTYGAGNGNAPVVYWNKDTYALHGAARLFTLDRNGAPLVSIESAPSVSQVITNANARFTFANTTYAGSRHCGFSACIDLPPNYTIYWSYSSDGKQTRGTEARRWTSLGKTAAATNGTDFVLTWIGERGVEALTIRNGEPYALSLVPAPADFGTTPSIASDGTRFLVVFEALGDIYGAYAGAVDAVAQPFLITTNANRPIVSTLGHGRFLVTYQRDDTLAATVIGPPSRRRSVR